MNRKSATVFVFVLLLGAIIATSAAEPPVTVDQSTVQPLDFAALGAIEPVARRTPAVQLGEARTLTGIPDELVKLSPVALAADDFDEDGVPDLVVGYEGAKRNVIALLRGNVEAVHPSGPANPNASEFLGPALLLDVEAPPQLVATGDFDNDGHRDLALAARGASAIHFLRGTGSGRFLPIESLAVDGAIGELLAGELGRSDGLADLMVTVSTTEGGRLIVFRGQDGALGAEATSLDLPWASGAMALGRFDGDGWNDLALASGRKIVIVTAELEIVRQLTASAPVVALAAGLDADLALLTADGMVEVLAPDAAGSSWTQVAQRSVTSAAALASRPAAAQRLLTSARLSGGAAEDLVVIDGGTWLRSIAVGEAGLDLSAELDRSVLAVLPMRFGADALADLVAIREGEFAPVLIPTSPLAVIVVNSPADTAVAGDGACTLREAIINANNNIDTTAGDCAAGAVGLDSIHFSIGVGPVAIALAAQLPFVTEAAVIDGTTQPGFAGTPIVGLDGSGAGPAFGLVLLAGSSTVRGLVIANFPAADGIRIQGPPNNRIETNYIGTDLAGAVPKPNGNGVVILDSSFHTIGNAAVGGGNLISANGNGVVIGNPNSTGNVVEGNLVGTDATGTLPLGNTNIGIAVQNSPGNRIGGAAAGAGNLVSRNVFGIAILGGPATANVVEGNVVGPDIGGGPGLGNAASGVIVQQASDNTIGGAALGSRNLISANGGAGIVITTVSSGNRVQGNYIGTDPTGTVALPNLTSGVDLENDATDNTIGVGGGNLISGNQVNGVEMDGPGTVGNVVESNLIGTDAAGAGALGNQASGVTLVNTSDNRIGSSAPGGGNVISANNDNGVAISDAFSIVVEGNRIGTDLGGSAPLGNQAHGVFLETASDITIGGAAAGARNVISANGEVGVALTAGSSFNFIEGNHIGVDVAGTNALGNVLSGVLLQDSANNFVGGSLPGAGNLISGNVESGVGIQLPASAFNTVQGNHIGTDVTGTLAIPNSLGGVRIEDGASTNLVGGSTPAERNVISGNFLGGVTMQTGANANTVDGNYIGTDMAGGATLGNEFGVVLDGANANTIGGSGAGSGNVISGNLLTGVHLQNGASATVIQGNLIGTDAGGGVALGNGLNGVSILNSPNNFIGGALPGERNVISGNQNNGVELEGPGTALNDVFGNHIGTDVLGGAPVANLANGVLLRDAGSNRVGGPAPGEGNVISGNQGVGVGLQDPGASGNLVQGNRIGTDTTGVLPVPNGMSGVVVFDGVNNLIGGFAPGDENRIAFNGAPGVGINGPLATGNSVLRNRFVHNAWLGIALLNNTPQPNDLGDPDAGPNELQNHPVLGCADISSGALVVDGLLNSTAGDPFRLEFFWSSPCHPSGFGEGENFLGFSNELTDAAGNAPFSVVLPPAPLFTSVTATATNPFNSTSEFSMCIPVVDCSIATALFPTVLAASTDKLVWGAPRNASYVRGELVDVSTYTTFDSGELLGFTSLDISADAPLSGEGIWYLFRDVCCGTWQTLLGAEPARDVVLP